MEKKIVVPYAPILVESTRSIGYSFEAAVADIIDNSISANATEVRVCFSSQDPQWLCIEDDGFGMSKDELETAMRYGSQSSQDVRRKNDLGRFGLGLKMASLSQCRKLTVLSKKDGIINAACWDLDYIIHQNDWALQFYTEKELEETDVQGLYYLKTKESGTVVLWQQFDRIQKGAANIQTAFDEKIELARKHVSLVFHRFISDEVIKNRLFIYFNSEPVKGLDPFLTKHPATQPMSEEVIRINKEEIRVKPYILPYISKMSKKDMEEVGGNEDLRQQQGFYIYRNKRLIIWGTWFRLIRQNELGKLARVRVDIPNSLDSIWEIDIKKSTASLPHFIKKSLVNIVENAVGRSERVYKYRGRKIKEDDLVHVWNSINNRGKIQYLVNRDIEIIRLLEAEMSEKGIGLLDSFIKMIEDTFPFADVYYRMAKNEVDTSENTLQNPDVYAVAEQMIQQLESIGGDKNTFLKNMDKMDFFIKYPEVVSRIREVYGNE